MMRSRAAYRAVGSLLWTWQLWIFIAELWLTLWWFQIRYLWNVWIFDLGTLWTLNVLLFMERVGHSVWVYYSYFQQRKKAGMGLGEGNMDASRGKYFCGCSVSLGNYAFNKLEQIVNQLVNVSRKPYTHTK